MVVCVVLNWNGCEDTLACLESLRLQTVPLRVVVVDNASTDSSVERLRQWIAAQPGDGGSAVRFELLEAGRNGGFAAGNNVGMRHALADTGTEFIWLLNNDTVAPPDTLHTLLATAAMHPHAGIVGSVLYRMDEPSTVQAWGGGRLRVDIAHSTHFTGASDVGAKGWADPTTYATFASVLLRRAALEAAGLLDEGYFMYYEDADLNLRMRAAGWDIALAEDTHILHREGGSRDSTPGAWTDQTTTESALRFLRKHGGLGTRGRAMFLLLRLGKRALQGDLGGATAVLRGWRSWRRSTGDVPAHTSSVKS